jgi:hypothetical protein
MGLVLTGRGPAKPFLRVSEMGYPKLFACFGGTRAAFGENSGPISDSIEPVFVPAVGTRLTGSEPECKNTFR